MLLQAKGAADPKEQEGERERRHQPQTSDPAGGRCCRRGLAGWRPGHAPTFADPSQLPTRRGAENAAHAAAPTRSASVGRGPGLEALDPRGVHRRVPPFTEPCARYNMILVILSTPGFGRVSCRGARAPVVRLGSELGRLYADYMRSILTMMTMTRGSDALA